LTRRSSGEAKAVCWCESCCHGRSVTNAFLVHHPPVSNRPPAASCEPSSLPRHHSVVFCAVAEARPKPPAPSPPVAVSQRSLSHDRPISAPVPETISSSASISVPPASPRDTEREGRNPHHTHRGQHRTERLMPSVLLLSFSPSLCCRAAVQQAGRQAGRQASALSAWWRAYAPSSLGALTGIRDSMIGPVAFTTALAAAAARARIYCV
jgi:hypothetical protein